ncbi:MAG: HEAT repeat domain-containing protein, partial [Planctomycetota bacterium]
NDAEGRVDACKALAGHPANDEVVAALRLTLLGDSFYGVRNAAVQSLAKIRGALALEALLEGADDPDPRVRRAAVDALGEFPGEESAVKRARQGLADFNDHVAAAAAGAIGRLQPSDAERLLERALDRVSYRAVVQDSALRALANLGDTGNLSTLVRWTSREKSPFARRSAASSIGRLGFLLGSTGRDSERRRQMRLELEGLLSDRNGPVRNGAVAGLGSLADPEALPVLIRIRDGKTGNFALAGRLRSKAHFAIKDILGHQARSTDRATLERRLRELEEQNQELRVEIEGIRKRLESGNQSPGGDVTKK